MWGFPPGGTTPAAEKIKCPDCYREVVLPGDAFKDSRKLTLECGCTFRRERLEKLLRRTFATQS